MNQLQVYSSGLFEAVRATMIDNEPWFVGSDVANALNYSNPAEAINDHVDDEDIMKSREMSKTNTKMLFINESGVYSLIFNSKQERAKEFKRWVTHEVLPTLRKTGQYSAGTVQSIEPDKAVELAKLISMTPKASLPYVLSALEYGGYNFNLPENKKPKPRKPRECFKYPKDEQLIAMLRQYYSDGFSAVELSKYAGVHCTAIYGLRLGKYNTNPQSAQAIKDSIPLVYKLHGRSRLYEINYAEILKEEN